MQERLLQYIWQHQYFNHRELRTEAGEPLSIISPGTFNTRQGPDFLHAVLGIGAARWAGHVELHIRSSDWDRHKHEHDPYYRNVILHVVWDDDRPAKGRQIPMLVLGNRIAGSMIRSYEEWMNSPAFVPCAGSLSMIPPEVWAEWKDKLMKRRLHRQAQDILIDLAQCRHNWRTAAWWRIARNFGIPVNGEVFEAIARSLPIEMLARQRPEQQEILLSGQAGLLENNAEYAHLKAKYGLQSIHRRLHFSGMRPAAAPARRLTQLAQLLQTPFDWLSRLQEAGKAEEIASPLPLAPGMKNSLLINSFIPLLYAYGLYYDRPALQEKALGWLRGIGPEKNARLTGWAKLGVTNMNAGESQALLELKGRYCDCKRCLDCAVGRQILRPEPMPAS